MEFLEKSLEDILVDAPADELRKRGLVGFYHHTLYRQVQLGSYGVADLIGVRLTMQRNGLKTLFIEIYELKQNKINSATLLQGMGYIRGVQQLLNTYDLAHTNWHIGLTLIGRDLEKDGNFCFTPEIFGNVRMFTYSYAFDGISFRLEEGYKYTNANIPVSTPNRIKNTIRDMVRDAIAVRAWQGEQDKANGDNLPF